MADMTTGLFLLAAGLFLLWRTRPYSREPFGAQWSKRGFFRWLGSIGTALGAYVTIKAIFGRSTSSQVIYTTAGAFLLAYLVVGLVYKTGRVLLRQ